MYPEQEVDTEVLERIRHVQYTPGSPLGLPAWRRLNALNVSSVALLATLALVAAWVHANMSGPEGPRGPLIALLVIFVLILAIFGAALFRDFNNRRHLATEKMIRDLLVYKHDETVAAAQEMSNEGFRRFDELLTRTVTQVGERAEVQTGRLVEMHEETRAIIEASTARMMNALLVLERVMPDLLQQAEWTAIAREMREAVADERQSSGGSVARLPSQHSRRNVAGLRPVP